MQGDKEIAKHFVPAVVIRDFSQPATEGKQSVARTSVPRLALQDE